MIARWKIIISTCTKLRAKHKREKEEAGKSKWVSVFNVPWLNDLIDGSLLQQLQSFNFSSRIKYPNGCDFWMESLKLVYILQSCTDLYFKWTLKCLRNNIEILRSIVNIHFMISLHLIPFYAHKLRHRKSRVRRRKSFRFRENGVHKTEKHTNRILESLGGEPSSQF